jgi:hypothetical protein
MPFSKLLVSFLSLLCFTSAVLAQQPADPAKEADIIFTKVETEAEYPGGNEAWIKFLTKNLDTDIAAKNGAPAGYYSVIIKFVVSRTGELTTISSETKTGYGTEAEVIRVIEKSGKWQPALQNGRPVNAYRRQPVTFAVIDADFDIEAKVPYTFFTGTENIITITAHKVKPEDLEVTLSKGSIKQIADGKYAVTVTQPGRVLLTLYNTKKQKEIGVASFEVKAGK